MRTSLSRFVAVAALAAACSLCLQAQKPAAKPAAPAAKSAAAPAKLGPGEYATFDTSKGKFVVELYPKLAPKSVANFVGLAEGKQPYNDPRVARLSMAPLYNGLLFFRTIQGYMIQTGDPLNNGTGRLGYTIPEEKNSLKFDQPGRVALAQAAGDPTSRGSQVFITVKAVPTLDKDNYLIIGQVVQGLEVVDALSQGAHKGGASGDVPEYPNMLNHVTIQEMH
ncbi:MAG TPA: peptidylprolyl isomerase [Terriglobales bacterium]|nr:peptidylprolyl isomerase [Terriglobales bacterium]